MPGFPEREDSGCQRADSSPGSTQAHTCVCLTQLGQNRFHVWLCVMNWGCDKGLGCLFI